MFDSEHRLVFGALDCAMYDDLCMDIEVNSFPTMRAFHIPGMHKSYTKRGADLHEGEYKIYEKMELVDLLQAKVAKLGNTSNNASAGAWAFSRSDRGVYCSLNRGGILAQFSAKSQSNAEKARDACEAFCFKTDACWGCSVLCAMASCQWNALHSCGVRMTWVGRISGDVTKKIVKRGGANPGNKTGSSGLSHIGSPSPALPAELPASPVAAALHMIDAELALMYSLRQGTAIASKSGTLQGEVLEELVRWLEFLASVLPSSRARRSIDALAQVANDGLRKEGKLEHTSWLAALDRRVIDQVPVHAATDPNPHWRLCGSYTCGLWVLFHIATVSAARLNNASNTSLHQKGTEGRYLQELPSQLDPLARIRGFVSHFFGCADCVAHFLKTYDECKFGVCRLQASDGPGAALWLWQVHNVVTTRVSKEQGREPPVPWPSRPHCDVCWAAAGEDDWDSAAVFKYLMDSYWQAEEPAPEDRGFIGRSFMKVLAYALTMLCGPGLLVYLGICAWRGCCSQRTSDGRECPSVPEAFFSLEGSSSSEE